MYKKFALLVLSAGVIATDVYAADENSQALQAIVVTGSGVKQNTAHSKLAKSTTVLSGETLRTNMGQTLGATLQNQLGVSSQSFGAGVGTPVIRGQSGTRVRVMQNSLGNNDASSLSPDHANGVDPLIAERIEVLRGASTLLYGSGAMGGIVNVIDNRIPEQMPTKLIGGAAEQRYDSVSDATASAVKLEGGKDHFAYHLDGFYRDQQNTQIGGMAIDEAAVRAQDTSFDNVPIGGLHNSDGFIANTQTHSRGGSAGFSLIGDKGLAGAAINQLEKVYGIPADGHGGSPVTVELIQTKYDVKGQLKTPLALADQVRMKLGYTDYQHIERDAGVAGATFLNKTLESRLELEQRPIGKINGTTGWQSSNSHFEGLGEGGKKILPTSAIDSYALFAVESLAVGAMTYELGGRSEWQTLTPEDRSAVFYVPLSGSASAQWDITEQHQLSVVFTHSQRAPQIQELFTDGFHDATHSYELGNAHLSKELSNNIDLSYRFKADWMTADLTVFHNAVSAYIYQQRDALLFNAATEQFVSTCPPNTDCFPLLTTQQAAASFQGFEAQAVLPLLENNSGVLDLTLFSDVTRGTFDQGGNVPRMPPLRYGMQLTYDQDKWSTNLRLTRGEAQTYAGEHDTNTAAYVLLNLGAQYRLGSYHDADVLLFANAKNLLDENIRNSTSYLRNFAPEPGRGAELGIRVSY